MSNTRLHLVAVVLSLCLSEIHGHGKMVDPLNRSVMGTSGLYPEVPPNYDANAIFCGGQYTQHRQNRGLCGPCGDNYRDPVPRDNENGGLYGTGIIVKRYRASERITVAVNLTQSHWGHFQFSICQLRNKNDVETEQCFNRNPLKLVDGDGQIGDKYHPGSESRLHRVSVFLPKGFRCEHCVLRWNYQAGNDNGVCEDGVQRRGCAPYPETFRNCADIAIL